MSQTRPISYAGSSPSPPPNTLRINYRHIHSPSTSPWRSLDLNSSHLSPITTIPELLHHAFDTVSTSKTRTLSLDDEEDPTRPSREVGITELDRIIRHESVLVGATKSKLDVVVHEEVKDTPKAPVLTITREEGGKKKGKGLKRKRFCEMM